MIFLFQQVGYVSFREVIKFIIINYSIHSPEKEDAPLIQTFFWVFTII